MNRKAIFQLTLSKAREFVREPAALFWVYGFPLLLALALGFAFRESPQSKIRVELAPAEGVTPARIAVVRDLLASDAKLEIVEPVDGDWAKRLRSGNVEAVVSPHMEGGEPRIEVWHEARRAESMTAKYAVESALKQPSGVSVSERNLDETGTRYIDFLMPGLIGINLLGGGLFGVGFSIVDMRVRKLLKRFLATPLAPRDFLISILTSRLIFTIPEVLALTLFGHFVFGVTNHGSWAAWLVIVALSAFAFSGMGLLIASRAKTIETASGLMNLAMLPMYVVSGVFFSSERFPEAAQPIIKLLPLTATNNSLRAIMNEGKGLGELGPEMLVLLGWGIGSFVVALKIFRWR